ncbi:hypothetical protein HDU98_000491 [Podochytrium sp. JEL0797]|nr:hypothetical protein HDU98_000491 [Podochytrium sp. JEL0797]
MRGPRNAMVNAKTRYHLDLPALHHTKPLRRRSVFLTDFSDELYTTNVQFGNGQVFSVDLDTGSSDVWIRGPACTSTDGSCGAKLGLPVINLADSTLKNTGVSFKLSYGSGSVKGAVYAGPVSLGGISATINFGVTTYENGFAPPGDGLWGLAYGPLNAISGGNYVKTAQISSLAFYFSDNVNGDQAELTINGVDSSKFVGTMQYGEVPLSSNSYYQINPSGGSFIVNAKSFPITYTVAIIDTGTSLLLMPNALSDSINAAIGAGAYDSNYGVYAIDCNIFSTGPTITIKLGAATIALGPQQYVMSNGDGATCSSGISQIGTIPSGGIAFIFGDTFLKSVYTVFDVQNSRLGFAKAVHPNAIVNPIMNGMAAPPVAAPQTTTTKTTTTTTTTTVAVVTKPPAAVPGRVIPLTDSLNTNVPPIEPSIPNGQNNPWISLPKAFAIALSASGRDDPPSDLGATSSPTPKQRSRVVVFPKLNSKYAAGSSGPVDRTASRLDVDVSPEGSEFEAEDEAGQEEEESREERSPGGEEGEENTSSETMDQDDEQDATPGGSQAVPTQHSIWVNDDVSVLAESANLSKEMMIELLRHRLMQQDKALGLSESSFLKMVAPKTPGKLIRPKWEGDKNYLVQNGKPTCFGQACSRNEYINAKWNMSQISNSQFMSPYWIHVDISQLTYTEEGSLLQNCRKIFCSSTACPSTPIPSISSAPTNTSLLIRIRRLIHLLNYFKTLSHPDSHCILSMSPKFNPSSPSVSTNFAPVFDAPIGEKIKRARFIGNEICDVFNASKSDALHYIGIHQCPKARQMIVALPKATPLRIADDSDAPKKRKSKKKGGVVQKTEDRFVYPTLTVRYIILDKTRFHQFHNPVMVAMKESFVTRSGIVYNSKLFVQLDSFCAESPADGEVLSLPSVIESTYPEVFISSTPSRKTSVAHWLLIETMPRIASYFEELQQNPHIRIHFNPQGGSKPFLVQMLRFLGISGFATHLSPPSDVDSPTPPSTSLESRLISGNIHANIMYIPEPNLYCLIPGEYQLHKLRSLIHARLPPSLSRARSWKEILLIRSKSSSIAIENHVEMVRMLEKEFRGWTIRTLTDGDAIPSLPDTFASFYAARIVIAPEGAALGYVVATQFGASVIEVLSEPQERSGWNLSYSTLARYLGITWYGMVLPKGGRVVDLVQLHGMVAAILDDLK